jgi:Gnt-I system low-affinity gluconate transporter
MLVLLPLLLIICGAIAEPIGIKPGLTLDIISMAGIPVVALLIACGAAFFILRPTNDADKAALRKAIEKSLEPVGVVLLVTGAGGAFKQVLVDTGAGKSLADIALAAGFNPTTTCAGGRRDSWRGNSIQPCE